MKQYEAERRSKTIQESKQVDSEGSEESKKKDWIDTQC